MNCTAVGRRLKPMQVELLPCSTTVAQLGFKCKATAVLKSNLVRSMAILPWENILLFVWVMRL